MKSRRRMEHRERHYPKPSSRCLVPLPRGYRTPVPWPRSRDMVRLRVREVGILQCTCKKFETMGIPCYHSSRILVQACAPKIPKKYLLARWSVDAKTNMFENRIFKTFHHDTELTGVIFQNHICRFTAMTASIAQGHEAAQQYMISAMSEVHHNVIELVGKNGMAGDDFENSVPGCTKINDPKKRRPKGIFNKRLKSHWEKRRKFKGKKNTETVELNQSNTEQLNPTMSFHSFVLFC